MTKLQQAQSNYVNEIKRVQENSDKWRDFLDFTAQSNISDGMSGYEFSTKLIIHSVNPNAKDCRTFDDWKTVDGNHVNYGEHGIPVLSRDNTGKQSVAYLFDTSQTAYNKIPERTELPETVKEKLKSALTELTAKYADNPAFSDEQKRLFKATAQYKLSKQYGLETSDNSEIFSGIEKLSVKDIANIGIALNGCSRTFVETVNNERSIFNEQHNSNQQRDDRTELTDENHEEWIWVEEYKEHAKKYEYDEKMNLWCKLNEENGTYEPLIEIPEPKPTAAMGKYGSLRLKFIWQTPCLIEAIMINGNVTKHCEEMNERVLNLIDEIVEKKKQSPEYKQLEESWAFLPRVQMLENFKAQAEEEILPVTVYAI